MDEGQQQHSGDDDDGVKQYSTYAKRVNKSNFSEVPPEEESKHHHQPTSITVNESTTLVVEKAESVNKKQGNF